MNYKQITNVEIIRHLCDDIRTRTALSYNPPYSDEFKMRFKSLTHFERGFLESKVYTLEWNIGSANLFALLQEIGLISMSRFVLLMANDECLQPILNDLLETQYALLANLVKNLPLNNSESITVAGCLEECFRRLIEDLCENPTVLSQNYLVQLRQHLPESTLQIVRESHLRHFLERDAVESLPDAIRLQSIWRMEIPRDNMLANLMNEIVSDESHAVNYLLKAITSNDFTGWKFALMFLDLTTKKLYNQENVTKLKSFLKEMFSNLIAKKCESFLYIVMLVARQLCSSDPTKFGTYASWYKLTIGEMKYIIKPDDWKFVMNVLHELCAYETDKSVIAVHIGTSISAPTLCYEKVIAFKTVCKARLAVLEQQETSSSTVDPNGSTLID